MGRTGKRVTGKTVTQTRRARLLPSMKHGNAFLLMTGFESSGSLIKCVLNTTGETSLSGPRPTCQTIVIYGITNADHAVSREYSLWTTLSSTKAATTAGLPKGLSEHAKQIRNLWSGGKIRSENRRLLRTTYKLLREAVPSGRGYRMYAVRIVGPYRTDFRKEDWKSTVFPEIDGTVKEGTPPDSSMR